MPSICALFKNASWSDAPSIALLPSAAGGRPRRRSSGCKTASLHHWTARTVARRENRSNSKKMKKGLSQILLVAAALGTTTAFTPATRSAAVAGVALNKAAGFEVVAHGLVALMANPTKRADHLASTDDPIDECVAVLANGEEPDEDMLAKCQDIAREEFASQATLEDENSY